ncbi:MAG: hypothetical protein ABIO70_03690 [Pseudomonadota bacterium]
MRGIPMLTTPTLAACFLSCAAVEVPDREERNPLLGKWKYVDCTTMNTSVDGTLEFKSGTFVFDGHIDEDYWTSPFATTYPYSLQGNRIDFTWKDNETHPAVAPYFLIEGEILYLSWKPMQEVQDDGRHGFLNRETNWSYKLSR